LAGEQDAGKAIKVVPDFFDDPNYAQEYGVHHVRMGYDSKGHLMSFAERGPLNPFSTIRHYSVCKVVEGVVGCFFVIPWHEESYRNVGVAGCAVGIFVL
jgi:hypothetical protein